MDHTCSPEEARTVNAWFKILSNKTKLTPNCKQGRHFEYPTRAYEELGAFVMSHEIQSPPDKDAVPGEQAKQYPALAIAATDEDPAPQAIQVPETPV